MIFLVEPNGDIFAAEKTRKIVYCNPHNRIAGSLYNLGADSKEFKERAYNCRCFGKTATQYDYDKFCYVCKTEKKIYKFQDNENALIYEMVTNLMTTPSTPKQLLINSLIVCFIFIKSIHNSPRKKCSK